MTGPSRTLAGLLTPDGIPVEGIQDRWSLEFAGTPAEGWTSGEIENALGQMEPEDAEACLRDLIYLAMGLAEALPSPSPSPAPPERGGAS